MATRRSSVGASVLDCFHLERSLVQTTNLWPLSSIAESVASAIAATENSTFLTAGSNGSASMLSSSAPSGGIMQPHSTSNS